MFSFEVPGFGGCRYLCLVKRRLDANEAAIGARIREVRTFSRTSQRLVSEQMGLSRDQLNRIERGEVAVRFFPAWNFCRFTGINALWLAFGETEGKFGFTEVANSEVPDDALFLDVMRARGDAYREYRAHQHYTMFEVGSVFSYQALVNRPKLNLADSISKLYLLRSMPLADTGTWEELRTLLKRSTQTPGSKASLAREFGVTTQAVSQWLSGASAPTADTALRLRKRLQTGHFPSVEPGLSSGIEQKKKGTGSATTRPVPKTRKSKSTSHEKAKSDQRKY